MGESNFRAIETRTVPRADPAIRRTKPSMGVSWREIYSAALDHYACLSPPTRHRPGERFALIEIANLVAILDVFVVGGSRSNDSGFDRRLRVSMDIVTGEGRKGVRRFASERTAEFGYLDRGGQWSLHCCSDFHEEGQSMNIK